MKSKLVGVWNSIQFLNNRDVWFSPNAGVKLGIKYSGGTESLKSFYIVYKELIKKNIEVKFLDEIEDLEDVDLFIFSNLDLKDKRANKALQSKGLKYLLLLEAEAVMPEMWSEEVYSKFDKIFTWNDNLVDNKKFFKVNCPGFDPFKNPVKFSNNTQFKKSFCVTTVSNKNSNHKLSTYNKRLEAIRWFEKFHPEKLDFYGWDWDKYVFSGPKIFRFLNRFPFIQKILAKKFKIYKGPIEGSKIPIYQNYRFSLCFENTLNSPGYITEKIFDSFFAGCIPIYLGGKNLIEKHIPTNTFINYEDFSNLEEMYDFLMNLDEERQLEYIQNIENFLNSSKFFIFTNEHYKKTLLKEILNSLDI
jgi:alpha(1,3/1,4) fucosyltransferase